MHLEFPETRGLFITGTDTGVGKTLISGNIARILAKKGRTVGVFKPVASGCERTREGLLSEDAQFLAFCADSRLGLDVITPITFHTPAAPFVCADKEHRKIDFEKIQTAYNYIVENSDCVVVEGIGGGRVPITAHIDVLDLAKAFRLPIVIVADAGLGTINHTLLTIDAVRNRGLPLAGVVINGYNEPDSDYAQMTNPGVIAELGKVRILCVVPFDETADVADCRCGEYLTNALSQVDWEALMEN